MQSKKVENGYFLRIDKGEEMMSAVTDFIEKKNIQSGVISGIGALTDVELGFFDRTKKEYLKKTFPTDPADNDIYELLSLNGNISYIDNNPMVHAHCVLGKSDYNVIGGHLFSGIVAVTGEVYIRTFSVKFVRKVNPEFNLKLLSF